MTRLRVAVVGSGPAGLATALTAGIANSAIAMTVFEMGRRHMARICPVDRQLTCSGCKGLCNVISGFGGSIHHGDAVKLSRYPAGRRLGQLLGDRYRLLEKRALSFFGVKAHQFSLPAQDISITGLRPYPVAELSAKDVQDWLAEKYHQVRPILRERARVVDVERRPHSGFWVTSHSPGEKVRREEFDIVVVASGRAGTSESDIWLRRLGIKRNPGRPSIGIRLELDPKLLAPLYRIHPDFKVSKYDGRRKIKTFCFSSHPITGGRLKFCCYQTSGGSEIYLDGHMNDTDADNLNVAGNFAVLAQVSRRQANDFIGNYRKLYSGRPIWQSFSDMVTGSGSISRRAPSLKDVRQGRVRDLFSDEILRSLVGGSQSVLDMAAQLNGTSPGRVYQDTIVVAPSYEFFWDEICVSDCFETSINGLFYIGDCAGIAQGALQAAIGGLAVSDELAFRI